MKLAMAFTVKETFQISGRGTVIVLDGATDLSIGHEYVVEVTRPDGATLKAKCFKEWLLRKTTPPDESEAFLVNNISKEQVPIGSKVAFSEE